MNILEPILLVASGAFLMAAVTSLVEQHVQRERCYFCWRRAWGHASVSSKAEHSETTWTVTRYHCHRHGTDALDLAAGTSSRLASAPVKTPAGGEA